MEHAEEQGTAKQSFAELPSVIVDGAIAGVVVEGSSKEELQHDFFESAASIAAGDVEDFQIPGARSSHRVIIRVLAMVAVSAIVTIAFVSYYNSSTVKSESPKPTELERAKESAEGELAAAQPQSTGASPSVQTEPAVAPVVQEGEDLEADTAADLPESEGEPQGSSPTDEAFVELISVAAAKHQNGKRKEALATYEAALALVPDSSEALGKVALLHLEGNQTKAAREFALKAVTANADNAEAWIVLGAARQTLGDAKGAREAYQQCAALPDPQYQKECRRMAR